MVAIHDGDTLTLEVATGLGLRVELVFRLYGIDAPELRTPEGVAARDFLRGLMPIGSPARVTVLLASSGEPVYTFGRCVGAVEFASPGPRGDHVVVGAADAMVIAGHARWVDRNLRTLATAPAKIPRWNPPG